MSLTASPLRTAIVVGLVVAASLAGGCGDAPASSPDTTAAPPITSTTAPPGGGDEVPAEVAFAVADLAQRLAVDESEVTVQRHEAVTWPDGAIGCPQPGLGYTQALVEGGQVILEAGGETYSYHFATGGDPFYCEDPQPITGRS